MEPNEDASAAVCQIATEKGDFLTSKQVIALLIASGGGLQVWGVLLAVKEVRGAISFVRDVVAPLSAPEPELQVPEGMTESDVRTLRLRDDLLGLTPSTRGETRAQVRGVDAEVRQIIHDLVARDAPLRIRGVRLIVAGLFLATVGSIWSLGA